MKNNYLVQAWLVLALAVGFGAALASVQVALQPRIDENKRNETYEYIHTQEGMHMSSTNYIVGRLY